MSRVDSLRKVPVKIPYKSGFDKSYRHTLTGKTGTLIPVFCDELMPNTDVYLRCPFVLRLPPLASDTFMNVDYKLEAFFVPTRLLMASDSYEKFMLGETKIQYVVGGDTVDKKIRTPLIHMDSDSLSVSGPCSLMDYLGFKSSITSLSDGDWYVSALPALAYHRIYEEWYRNSLIQTSIYSNVVGSSYSPEFSKSVVPSDNSSVGYVVGETEGNDGFADGSIIFDLRQRNFGADYFTVATTSPQNGPAIGVGLNLNTSYFKDAIDTRITDGDWDDADMPANLRSSISDRGVVYYSPNNGDGSKADSFVSHSSLNQNQTRDFKLGGFTIASLRAANSLQQFLERNNIAGNRFVDYLKANYGADLKDGVAQRPVYLGSVSVPVYSNGVLANGEPDPSSNTSNPFNTVASQYGTGHAEGNDFVLKFHNDEPGYLFVIGSLVPEVSYSSGISRMLMRYTTPDSRTDMANHLLQNVGPQPIFIWEGSKNVPVDKLNTVFGFVDRYADWMVKNSCVSGLVRDGQNLDAFVLQRSFNSDGISSTFLSIPTDFLDQVMSVDSQLSGMTYWADFYFEYKLSMPLARYSIPSLQDPAYEHGDTVWLNRGGVRID